MESSIMDIEEIMINAGQRGLMLKMAPGEIVKTLNCKVMSIAKANAGVKKRPV
jgi:prolyl-tRNA editing enzyme YbaK/EbsC (Cys-tRNA(Pro) deacylase)